VEETVPVLVEAAAEKFKTEPSDDCLVMQRVELRYVAPTSLDNKTRAVHTITLPTSNTDYVLPFPTPHFTPPSVAAGRAWRPRISDKAMRLSATLPQDP
jgi:hypothetical protein